MSGVRGKMSEILYGMNEFGATVQVHSDVKWYEYDSASTWLTLVSTQSVSYALFHSREQTLMIQLRLFEL